MVSKNIFLFIVASALLLSGCFKKNIMFQTDRSVGDSLLFAANKLEKSYIIHSNDFLDVQVFTNNGERLVDPNFAIPSITGSNGGAGPASQAQLQPVIKYLVQYDGYIDLPMIGRIRVDGYDLHQTDSCLAKEYGKFYKGAFVYTRLLNKRVFVFGSSSNNGGGAGLSTVGKVVNLENENMNIIEVMAIAGGIDYYSKVHNIRLIRGDLKNPSVQVIDLHTIEGIRKANLAVQPNDILYIEKYNRRFSQTLVEITPAISLISSMITLIVLIATLKK